MKLRGPQILALTFLALILVGSLLLELPVMSRDDRALSYLDALFTATSAVCVTGLATVNPAEQFSPLGYVVLVALIQLGGLGIMTFSALFLVLLRRQLDTESHRVLSDTFSGGAAPNLRSLLVVTVAFCFACEGIGALLLFATLPEAAWDQRLFSSIFHSVSAFCNAGFSTYPDSLIGLSHHPAALLVVMVLIVVGGLGFFVVHDVGDRLIHWRRRRQLRLQTRLVLGVSLALIVLGALGIHLSERHNTLRGMGWGEQVLHCVFQSVSARTAGFNSIDIGAVHQFGLFLLILLMFVGGSPGSTAGGVKTTTLGIILATLWSHLRGREEAEVLGRRIPRPVVQRAFSVVAFSFAITASSFILLHGAGGYLPAAAQGAATTPHPDLLLPLGFEVVSAYATVGLSANVTPDLTDFGKVLIILLMFVGRLGPLTLAVALVTDQRPLRYTLPSENVMVG